MKKYTCILDTDIGDDIDDAIALSLLLSNDEIDLKAVTTVYKNTKLRARQAKELIRCFNSDVNVYYGEGMPLSGFITPFNTDYVHETGDYITNKPPQFDDDMPSDVDGNAVDIIIKTAKENSKELIVLGIGPLTNIASAIKKDPSIKKDIKKIIIMGGWYTNYASEWNILCDPVAASIVFNSGIDVYACGLDVTLQCAMSKKVLNDILESNVKFHQLLRKYYERWCNYFHFEKSVMHDPLAITCVTDDVCTFVKKYVKVEEVVGSKNYGAIRCEDGYFDGSSSIYVAETVDSNRFNELVEKRFWIKQFINKDKEE